MPVDPPYLAADWANRVVVTLKLLPDAKGLVIPSLAAAPRRTAGIALDEFQELTKLGCEDAL